MFSIYTGSWLLHHPMSPDRIAISAKIITEVNTHGSLDMTLDDPKNLHLRSPIEVYDTDGMIWRGRVLTMENGFTDTRKIVNCEGALAFLCDTIVQPFSFHDGSPADFFSALITNHNEQLGLTDPRRFTIGTVNVVDPGGNIYRSSESAMTTWECIKSRLLDTVGGYIYLSGENLNVINYVADFVDDCNQTIHFGENIISLVQSDSAANIITALFAYGATNDSEHPESEPTGTGLQLWNGNRIHLNGAVVYQAAYDIWGLIYGTKVFDDVTTAEGLMTAATDWMAENYQGLIQSLDLTAADLSANDITIDRLDVGKYVHVIVEPLLLDVVLLCVRKEMDLLDDSQTRVSVGRTPATISGIVAENQQIVSRGNKQFNGL